MTLKVGIQHRVFKYYQVCSNDDLGLTLTYFTARSNLVPYSFVWEKSNIMDFSETIVVYDIKVGRFIQLNEYINLYDYQRSRPFIDLCPRSLRLNIFKLLLLGNRWADWSQFPYGASMWCEDWKFVQMSQVTWPCPYIVKNFKNFLLRNQEADDLETWYTASGTRVLRMLSYDDHGLTSTIFMTGSNLFPNASTWAKPYIQHWVLLYFQVCSNSAYPRHSGERYRTSASLVWYLFMMT